MKNELRIGNLVLCDKEVKVITSLLIEDVMCKGISEEGFGLYYDYSEISPIKINEERLLGFGFKKVEEICNDYTEVYYELGINSGSPDSVYLSYADDWSIAIYDSKEAYNTHHYITPNIGLADEVHKLQNLFYSLVGKELIKN